ncbi:hypothetical protein VNI00_011182 [Paramarasmius palmivorus]|uniref:Chromo domain-containing protein n=1 Tax=Paramarasmius palmivorus TaxID=297713 RepID=A0AAW0CFK7_9AGAR
MANPFVDFDPELLQQEGRSVNPLQPGQTRCPLGIRSAGQDPTTYFPPTLHSNYYRVDAQNAAPEELFEGFTPEGYLDAMKRRFEENERRWDMVFGLCNNEISAISLSDLDIYDSRFLYPISHLSHGGAPVKPPQQSLTPHPISIKEPGDFRFPRAPTYELNCSLDRLYIHAPVEGMIPMPLGVPFVATLAGDPRQFLSVACFLTLDVIQSLYPTDYILVKRYFDEVEALSWGDRDHPPLFMMDGLKLNHRSGGRKDDCYDGSSSHGPTVEEVGDGFIIPASQACTDLATIQQIKLTTRLSALYRLIMPLCVSKMEWDAWVFRAEDLNAICCGGSFGFSGLQMNVSSAWKGGSLSPFIGILQGAWHPDVNDDPIGWTLLVALLRLPAGSSIGDFLLGRLGLYARLIRVGPNGLVHFFLSMKGIDLHSGIAPTADTEAREAYLALLEELYSRAGPENRIVYVLYPTSRIFRRDAGVSMTAPVGFGNQPGGFGKQRPHTVASDGVPALGSWDDRQIFLTREVAMHHYNHQCMAGLNPSFPRDLHYVNLRGEHIPVRLPFDPEQDYTHVMFMRSIYGHLDRTASLYTLSMNKSSFFESQEKALRRYQDLTVLPSSDLEPISAPKAVEGSGQRGTGGSSERVLRSKSTTNSSSSSKPSKSQTKEKNTSLRVAVKKKSDQVAPNSQASHTASSNSKEYPIAFLVDSRFNLTTKEREFQVRWEGYWKDEDTWEPEDNVKNTEAYEAFIRKVSGSTDTANHELAYLCPFAFRSEGEGHNKRSAITTSSHVNRLLSDISELGDSYAGWNSLGTFTPSSATLLLSHIKCAASSLQNAPEILSSLEVMHCTTALMVCRSLRFIYVWRVLFGPELSKQIFAQYPDMSSTITLWPEFSELANTITKWVQNCTRSKQTLELPGSLFGLTENSDSLSIPCRQQTFKDVASQRDYAVSLFIDAVFRAIVLPSMQPIDIYLNSLRKQTPRKADQLAARTLLRGAVLDCLVDWLDDDGIFASPDILQVLANPSDLISCARCSDEQLSDRLIRGHVVFASVESWLRDAYDAGDIQETAAALSEAIQQSLVALAQDPAPTVVRKSTSIRRAKGQAWADTASKKQRVPEGETLTALLPYTDGLRVDILAFIIRETLNHQAKRGVGDSSLNNIIQGKDPLVRKHTAVKNPDHLNPIRSFNVLQTMIKDSFASRDILSERYGLSNLLVILGTGQGEVTKTFFKRHLHGRIFSSAQDCVAEFNAMYSSNSAVRLDNKRCWGPACSWLGFIRSDDGIPNFQERLEPMFSSHVISVWLAFCHKEKRTYEDALALGPESKIDGFNSGITQMQLANTLALLGLCEMPNCDRMGTIIWRHSRKGAFEGLQRLGLDISRHSTETEVRQAFRCVYDFLDHKLVKRDKDILDFNAIFVEHLLCKVTRWEKAFPSKVVNMLRHMAEQTRKGECGLVLVATAEDHPTAKHFPFELEVERTVVEQWISNHKAT